MEIQESYSKPDGLPFYAKSLRDVPNAPGTWKSQVIGVFSRQAGKPDQQIGEYTRNYHTLFRTFYPFQRGDQWLALYSPRYTEIRVMRLPDCTDLGRAAGDFCPVEFYVPYLYEHEFQRVDGTISLAYGSDDPASCVGDWQPRADGPFAAQRLRVWPQTWGLVAGCYWGDDSSWKIEYLDLTQALSGSIQRDDRFGYIELPPALTLAEAVDASGSYAPHGGGYRGIRLSIHQEFDLDTGEKHDIDG